MSDPATSAAAVAPAQPEVKEGFQFTDGGCRTELRLGLLLVLGAAFLWLFLGPKLCLLMFAIGALCVVAGSVMQVIEAGKGRPGYPAKMGIALTLIGALMWPELVYRETPGGVLGVQPIPPCLLGTGLWLLALWPLARLRARRASQPASEGVR